MHELTIGIEYGSRMLELQGRSLNIQIYDTVSDLQSHTTPAARASA